MAKNKNLKLDKRNALQFEKCYYKKKKKTLQKEKDIMRKNEGSKKELGKKI